MIRARLDDLLRYNPVPQGALSLAQWAAAAAKSPRNPAWVSLACAAARCAPTDSLMQRIEKWMLARLDLSSADELWSWYPTQSSIVEVKKTAILKPATNSEQGVVFISFESQWEKLLQLGSERLAEFVRRYQLVVAPTWSPPHSVTNVVFPRLFPGLLPCTISNLLDLEVFPRLHPSYKPVQLFASSWVNPELYRPKPRAERDIDLLMIANFGRYKRHHALFRALSQIPKNNRPRVTLVGQPHGDRTAEVLVREMEYFGVKDNIALKSRISDQEVVDILCRSRAAVITSLREGSCVAVVEAMMADTPLGLLKGAHIGSSAFLNEHTGRWLDGDRLGEEIVQFIQESDSCSPRQWLLDHGIECATSTRTLNDHLRGMSTRWSKDIAAHHWRPDPQLLTESARAEALSEAELLRKELGLVLA
ncbi:MAG: glycosyltransferase [Verrucomicrobiaceae bacterium]|nr:glycosyltransferase [Verrucomicrobiaceae bacterium]